MTTACSRSLQRAGNPAATTSGTGDASAAFPAAVPSGERLGTVRVIGTGQRFVLVETPSAQPVSRIVDGQALVCRTAGVVSATLRVSRERRPPFVVADVAAGEPHVGDEVFIDATSGRAAVAAPAGPTLFPATDASTPGPAPEFHTNPALPPSR